MYFSFYNIMYMTLSVLYDYIPECVGINARSWLNDTSLDTNPSLVMLLYCQEY